jgi:hypothetical protein
MKKFVSQYSILCGAIAASVLVALPMRADTITYTGATTTFTATTAGVYDIVAYGAGGGGGNLPNGGLGAEIGGDFTLSAGEMLTIDVGGAGGSANSGGGGGRFDGSLGTNAPTITSGTGGNTGGAGGTGVAGGSI